MANEKSEGRSRRGFGAMDREQQRRISRKGGESVRPEDRSFSRDRALASAAGRKGAVSRNMAAKRARETGSSTTIPGGQVVEGERQASGITDEEAESVHPVERREAGAEEEGAGVSSEGEAEHHGEGR